MITTWKEELTEALKTHNETWEDVEESTLTEEQLVRKFDDSYGSAEGEPFTVWTSNTVYFPIVYDGCEWVGSVSRNPNGKPTNHQGGE